MFEFPQPFESSTNGLSIEESPKKNPGGKARFSSASRERYRNAKEKRRKKKEKEKEEQFSCSLILSYFS